MRELQRARLRARHGARTRAYVIRSGAKNQNHRAAKLSLYQASRQRGTRRPLACSLARSLAHSLACSLQPAKVRRKRETSSLFTRYEIWSAAKSPKPKATAGSLFFATSQLQHSCFFYFVRAQSKLILASPRQRRSLALVSCKYARFGAPIICRLLALCGRPN